MPRASPILTNFTAGEFSPRLAGRVDLSKYFNACKTLKNMLIYPQGGASRRPGTYYAAAVKASADKTRVIPFEFSVTQAYIIEVGDLYFRFYKDQGQIVSGSPLAPVEVVTTYLEADLFEIQHAQSADTLYLVHQDYAPRKLTRTSHTAWTLTVIDFNDGPYLDQNTDAAKTLTPSGTTGTITITATGHSPFVATDVGRYVRIYQSSPTPTWGWAKITVFGSSSSVTAVVQTAFTATSASPDWRLGAWSDTTGYPNSVAFYGERLIFAGSKDNPQTIWGSKVGGYEDFAPAAAGVSIADADPITFTLATNQVNVIRWLSPGKVLSIGTVGGEFIMRASTQNEPITPSNVTVNRETTHGSKNLMPFRIGNVVLFVQRAGRKLRELGYDFNTDSYIAEDMTILSEHITSGGINEMAYQEELEHILWCVRNDGVLLGMTYERGHDVIGWHRQIIGGSFGAGDAVVESVAVISGTNQDEIWVVVKRTVNGSTVRYVEYFKPTEFDDLEDAFFVDSGLTYSGAAVSTLTGLDHLEGETVAILGDGAVFPDEVVASGAITLDSAVSKAQVGLPYTSELETMSIEPSQEGVGMGKIKRVHEVIVKLQDTLGAKMGPSNTELDIIPFRKAGDPMDSAPPLFTGNKVVKIPSSHGLDAHVVIVQDQPLPLTVLSMAVKMGIEDG